MVNLFKRMRKLKTRLLNIRLGTGAALLPSVLPSGNPSLVTENFPPVTRLHLTYAKYIYGGHQGARHFWRNCLTRLKYYNPGIPMTVKQIDEQDGVAALTIYFAERLSAPAAAMASKNNGNDITDKYAPAPLSSEKHLILDAKNIDYVELWNRVKSVTGAKEVTATQEEKEELQRLAALREKATADRSRVASIYKTKKDQERMLQEAKGEVEKLLQS